MKTRFPKVITTANLNQAGFDAEIVRRCNVHTTMLQVLNDVDKHLSGEGYVSPESEKSQHNLHPTTLQLWKTIRAAIKAAEGE